MLRMNSVTQAVIADMAKWGSWVASGARTSSDRIRIFCMAGFHTIILDGLRGVGDVMSALGLLVCGKTGVHWQGSLG